MAAKYSNPLEFAKYLDAKKNIWKRGVHSQSIGAKRHYRDLIRRTIKTFRLSFGSVPIPKIVATCSNEVWLGTSNLDVKVILSKPSLSDLNSGDHFSRDVRKILRRAVRSNIVGEDGTFELVSAKNVSTGRENIVARSSDAESVSIRGVYFDKIGVAVVPGLTDIQVAALEADGIVVLSNDPIELDGPVPESTLSGCNFDPWHLTAIGIMPEKRKFSGKGVTIGVLDTGISPEHPEFIGKRIEYLQFDYLGLPIKSDIIDFGDHGTHVSALAAGRNVGVAPDANLAVAAVLTEKRNGKMVGYTAQILGGLDWLASKSVNSGKGVDVVNASFGGSHGDDMYLDAFRSHYLRGHLVVASIGNDGKTGIGTHTHPGRFDFVVGVGACDRDNNMADFSAWGSTYSSNGDDHKPDLVAPGVAVHSANGNGKYKSMSGTSMACPLVAGAAALIIEANEALRGEPDSIKKRLFELTSALPPTPHNNNYLRSGKGRLDLSQL